MLFSDMAVERRSLFCVSLSWLVGILRWMPSRLPSLVSRSPDGCRRSTSRRHAMVLPGMYTETGKSASCPRPRHRRFNDRPETTAKTSRCDEVHGAALRAGAMQSSRRVSAATGYSCILQRWCGFSSIVPSPAFVLTPLSQLPPGPRELTWTALK